ncbi:MAG: UbiD family decarboxylase [Candidatus Korarchaeota archaeon]|nr:UbiD family decarboxylase [Candidatus Korarchaeota archaeon]
MEDLRSFLERLEGRGELRKVKAPVSVELEIAEILRRVARGGPALLFENIEGFEGWRLAGNLFSKIERVKLALGVERLEDAGERFTRLARGPPPLTLGEKVRTLREAASFGRYLPKISKALWKDNEWDEPDLNKVPAIRTWPKDAGRFFTFPIVITRDPETGIHHFGVYRMQIMGKDVTGMHWHIHKRGAAYYEKYGEEMPVAVAVGVDPAVAFAAVAPVPEGIDSYLFAGVMAGRSIRVARGESGLLIPSSAELVMEGTVPPSETRIEGPFGDHMGYYTPPAPFPVFRVRRMYTRENPIFHATVVGYPWLEDAVLGKAVERIFLPFVRMLMPEVVDLNLPEYGLFHGIAVVSIRKRYPGHAKQVAMGLLGLGQFSLTKMLVVVDHDVDVHDLNQVMYAVASTVDPQRDVQIVENAVADELDHASVAPRMGGKMIMDATRKLREEIGRDWPEPVAPDPEVARRVDERWSELGI